MPNLYTYNGRVVRVGGGIARNPSDNTDAEWTDLDALINSAPYASSRIVYVSTSGNDGTGTIYSPASSELGGVPTNPTGSILPYATLSAAWNQIRDGNADVMLLRRGDTWSGAGGDLALNKAGASATARIIVAAYGSTSTARPAAGLVRPTSSSTASNQIIAHIAMTLSSSGDITFSGQTIRHEGCSFTGPGSGETPALIMDIANGWTGFRNSYYRVRLFGSNVMGLAGFDYQESAFYHNPDYTHSGGAQHNIYFNFQEGNGVSRFNISAFSPGVGLRQRGLGTVEGNLVLSPGTTSGWGFDIGTESDPDPTNGSRGTYLTFRYNQALHCPNADATFFNIRDGLIEQNIFVGRFAYGHDPSVWDFADITMQDNILYNTNISPWGGHSGTIAGPWLIRRNDFQRPAGGGLMNLSGAGFTFEANNRYYSTDPQSGWFDTAYSNWVPSTGSNTNVSYTDPGRDLITYMESLGYSPADAEQAIEWFMNGTTGFAGAMNNRLGAWDDRSTARAVINYVRAGFGLGAIP